jgi:FAD/FMN-containing dehydrogenase/Fe-S oxidoreductase
VSPGSAAAPAPGRLEAALRAAVRGEVGFDAKARALHATDASNYRHVPLGVVAPVDVDDVVAAVAACRAHGVPVTVRGGGTSIAGNATGPGVVLDLSRHLTRVVEVDPVRRTATAEAGVVLDRLNDAAAVHGLRFAPDPSSHGRCTLGGMLGNDACGAHSVRWGRTSDNVESLDVLLYDGTRLTVGPTPPAELARLAARTDRVGALYRDLRALAEDNRALLRTAFPALPRRVSGYALDRLLPEHGVDLARALVGSEGTCAVVLRATVRLVEPPAAVALLVAGFTDDAAAADAVPAILALGPLAVEGMDRELVQTWLDRRPGGADVAALLPPGDGWLFVEVGGATAAGAGERAGEVAALLAAAAGFTAAAVVREPAEQRALWRVREEGAGLATRLPDGTEAFPGWEDAAVPPDRLGTYLRELRALLRRHGLRGVTYGHYGDGCCHTRIDYDLLTEPGRAVFRSFVEDAADLVVALGGSLSGEHGDGQARAELLPRMYGPQVVELFARFKAVWDPDGGLNPGVLVRPRSLDTDLRVGARAARPVTDVVFGYAEDGGDLAKAVRRCVGIGRCRTETGGVMCPSWRVTHEEQHSTRGRAHLLLEMLEGDVLTDGWRSREVREALDLCLGCKGCASDCPVNVDMATYKAEFLHRHYRRRLRPAAHYSMGWLPVWARLAALAPCLANAVTAGPVLGRLVRRLGGLAPDRELPRFAGRTFSRWFAARSRPATAGPTATAPRVLLWPDTFTEHFAPEVGRAAVRVLESAGLGVDLPAGRVCCGLTYVATGQLGTARRVLRRTLATLEPYLGTDGWVVGLEPSCTAALRADLPSLLPDDPRARRLAARVLTLAEALDRFAPAGWAPQVDAASISQPHCHQHAVLGTDADRRVMARVGLRNTGLDAGCCGQAGSFGFERGHEDVAAAVGELALLPAVRSADPATVVLADGFSCRLAIARGTGRRAVHLAEAIDRALGQPSRR